MPKLQRRWRSVTAPVVIAFVCRPIAVLAEDVVAGGFDLERSACDAHMADNLGWLQEYVDVGFFTDFRKQAWQYYKHNETSYAFLWLNSIAYANLDFVREVCPPAAQLAVLIRAEERMPVREAEGPLLEYAVQADAAEKPQISVGWPLAQGLERLRRLSVELAVPDEYSVDMVLPYCDEPLDGLLSRSTGYDDEWLSARVPLGHVNLILYRLVSCITSNPDELPERANAAAIHFRSVEVVPVDASPKAWEAARYLLHLASRYDRLADFTLFLHPDVFEHANPRTLRNLLHSLRVGTFTKSSVGAWYEYLSLSHHYITRPSRITNPHLDCADVDLAFEGLYRAVFLPNQSDQTLTTPLEWEVGKFGFYCCSQFIVHRDRVKMRPREWYQRVAQSIPWEHCATSYMELLWHGIFNGGRLHEAKRQERPELPLFMRVDNFIENTSDGLV